MLIIVILSPQKTYAMANGNRYENQKNCILLTLMAKLDYRELLHDMPVEIIDSSGSLFYKGTIPNDLNL